MFDGKSIAQEMMKKKSSGKSQEHQADGDGDVGYKCMQDLSQSMKNDNYEQANIHFKKLMEHHQKERIAQNTKYDLP